MSSGLVIKDNAARSPKVPDKLEAIGFVATGKSSPAEFAATARRDLEHVGKIAKAAGIEPE